MAPRAHLEYLEHLAMLVRWVQRGQLARRESRVCQDRTGFQETPARKGMSDQLVRKAFLGPPDRTETALTLWQWPTGSLARKPNGLLRWSAPKAPKETRETKDRRDRKASPDPRD